MSKREWAARAVAQPEPGYFLMRLVRGGPMVSARILRDGAGRWQAIVDAKTYPPAADPAAADFVFRIWHGGEIISETEYLRHEGAKARAIAANPLHPATRPRQPIDLHNQPSIF
jgi:hypothetical protein